MKAATAYMLVYGSEDTRVETDVKVPEMVRERINLENTKVFKFFAVKISV